MNLKPSVFNGASVSFLHKVLHKDLSNRYSRELRSQGIKNRHYQYPS